MIALIDAESGNLRSVARALEAVGGDVTVTQDAEVVADAEQVVLPGVGAFGDTMATLSKHGLVAPLRIRLAAERPFLGICLGMQVLFDGSDEDPSVEGLGVLPGRVHRLAPVGVEQDTRYKVPHMGWNALQLTTRARDNRLFRSVQEGAYVYFCHSYHCVPEDTDLSLAVVSYGGDVVAAVGSGSIWGVQFHPEKSQKVGLELLADFVRGNACG